MDRKNERNQFITFKFMHFYFKAYLNKWRSKTRIKRGGKLFKDTYSI